MDKIPPDGDGVTDGAAPDADKNSAPGQPAGARSDTYTGVSPHHALQLKASGISPDVARERGYRTVTVKAELKKAGFAPYQCSVPALLIPIRDVHGEIATYQLRPDEPRISRKSGKPLKYENIADGQMVLDVPARTRSALADPKIPLFVTEGSKKVDALATFGLASIGVLGVFGWRGKNDEGGKTALADLEYIAWNGRTVYLVFDSDVVSKIGVFRALERLKGLLESRKAIVKIVYLPAGEGGRKTGIDDFLAAGNSVDDLLAHASDELRKPPLDDGESDGLYVVRDGGIWWRKIAPDGTFTMVALTNFIATIAAEIDVDDGDNVTRLLVVKASHGTVTRTVRLSTKDFTAMDWPIERLAAGAWVAPGSAMHDRAAIAIQELSGEIRADAVYGHLGWRNIDGKWMFLHAGGAIGAQGPVDGIAVEAAPDLRRLVLPPPAAGRRLADCTDAAMSLLGLGPRRLALPLFALPFRAVLGRVDFTVHVEGETGAFKSARAALTQAFFGAGFDDRTLPATWIGTSNANERLAFEAKDVVLTIDDFNPRGTAQDIAKVHREADRLIRAAGNQAGRLRMRQDSSLRTSYYPRCALLSTGETVPSGQSTVARMLVIPVKKGEINVETLSKCQRDAAAGMYAELMSAFVAWVAADYDAIQKTLPAEIAELRSRMSAAGVHRRLPEILAQLIIGIRYFGRFLLAKGLDTKASVEALENDAWSAFREAAAVQGRQQTAGAPHVWFLELVSTALASGRAHLANPSGGPPDDAPRWGWRIEQGRDDDRQVAQGERIGYVSGDDVYLVPAAVHSVIQRIATAGGESFPVSAQTLGRRLRDHGLLASVEETRETLTIRRKLEGRTQQVFHMTPQAFGVERSRVMDEERVAEAALGGEERGRANEAETRIRPRMATWRKRSTDVGVSGMSGS